ALGVNGVVTIGRAEGLRSRRVQRSIACPAQSCQCCSQLDFCVPSQCILLIFREFEEGLAKSPDLLADELRLFPRVSRLLELQEKRVVLEALHQVSGPSFVSASACDRAEKPCSLLCVDAAEPAPALPARS